VLFGPRLHAGQPWTAPDYDKEFAAELQRRAAAITGRPMSAEEQAADPERRAATARKNFQHARTALRPLVAEFERSRPRDGTTTGRGETR
jgi:hypothetical protein